MIPTGEEDFPYLIYDFSFGMPDSVDSNALVSLRSVPLRGSGWLQRPNR